MKGLHKAGYLADASSLCGACVEVCPVKIPITEILLRLRHNKEEEKHKISILSHKAWKVRAGDLVWKGWKTVFANPKIYRLNSLGIAKLGNYAPPWMPVLRNWTSVRSVPVFAKKNLHQLVREEGLSHE